MHLPDAVEGVVDGADEQQGGEGEEGEADGGEVGGVALEGGEVAAHRACALGDEVAVDKVEHGGGEAVVHREGGEDVEGDGEHGHECQQGGEGEAGGHLRYFERVEAAAEEGGETERARAAQGLAETGEGHGFSVMRAGGRLKVES